MSRPIGRPKVLYGQNVNVKLSAFLEDRVLAESQQRRMSISEVVRQALQQYFEAKEQPRRIPYK